MPAHTCSRLYSFQSLSSCRHTLKTVSSCWCHCSQANTTGSFSSSLIPNSFLWRREPGPQHLHAVCLRDVNSSSVPLSSFQNYHLYPGGKHRLGTALGAVCLRGAAEQPDKMRVLKWLSPPLPCPCFSEPVVTRAGPRLIRMVCVPCGFPTEPTVFLFLFCDWCILVVTGLYVVM